MQGAQCRNCSVHKERRCDVIITYTCTQVLEYQYTCTRDSYVRVPRARVVRQRGSRLGFSARINPLNCQLKAALAALLRLRCAIARTHNTPNASMPIKSHQQQQRRELAADLAGHGHYGRAGGPAPIRGRHLRWPRRRRCPRRHRHRR